MSDRDKWTLAGMFEDEEAAKDRCRSAYRHGAHEVRVLDHTPRVVFTHVRK